MAARAPSNITPDTTIDMTAQPGMEVDDRPTLLVVDDDVTFCTVLANAMTKRSLTFRAHKRSNRHWKPQKRARPSLP